MKEGGAMAVPAMTDFNLSGLRLRSRGKVRNIYEGQESEGLMLVASDRVSAFDVVFDEGVPDKGRVLSQLSAWWFDRTRHIIENHLVAAEFDAFPNDLRRYPEVKGRSMFCRPAKVIPIECVARGYLDGSAWKEYQKTGRYLDHELPPGLKRYDKLPEPIFTPATKADVGHDENITYAQLVEQVGEEVAAQLRDYTLRLYRFGAQVLEQHGIILADTKFEFGWVEEMGERRIILIDEALTPDSSRFWVKGETKADGSPVSFDKQFLRDWLEQTAWNKQPPAPSLPPEVIETLTKRYFEIFERITGRPVDLAA
jgi:phosphoribosylaminoimidazole-succinocarboxamide synthase